MSKKGENSTLTTAEAGYINILKANYYVSWLLSAVMAALFISIQIKSASAGNGLDFASPKADWTLFSLLINLAILYFSAKLLKKDAEKRKPVNNNQDNN